MSIRKRLFIAFLLVVSLGFYFLVDWIIDDLRPRYLEAMEETMIDAATILSSLVEGGIVDDKIATDDLRGAFDLAKSKEFSAKIYNVLKTNLNMRVYIVDKKGFVILDSDKDGDEGQNYSSWNDVLRTMQGQYGARATRVDPDDPKSTILYVASPVRINGEIAGVLTVCKPTDSVTLFFNTARKQIIWAGVATAIAVVLMGMLISSWITHPIQKLTRYARDVRDGRRVSAPVLGSSEIGELGSAFEEMRDALEGRQYVENYVQTLTHEMKSPLSAIYGAAELLNEDMSKEQSRQFIENIRAETARIQDLVDRLLQLSSLEKRKGLRDVEAVDAGALIRDVVESVGPILSNKKIHIEFDEQDPIVINGERFLLRQAIANLLQNAIDFSPPEGSVNVSLKKVDEWAEIVVLDKGPGIPGYALDRIFDRFYSLRRPDTGKKSSGLGLTFVREVASLHGGRIEIYNYPEGGAGATMMLPV